MHKDTESESRNCPILLVDDEDDILLTYAGILKSEGFKDFSSVSDPRQVIPFLEKHEVKIVLLDLSMPFINGTELIPMIRESSPETEIIIITARNEVQTAVQCMKMGVADYLLKPVEKSRLVGSIRRSMEIVDLKSENLNLKKYLLSEDLDNSEAFARIITQSNKMFLIFKYIEAISHSPFPVLITGETGTGKELVGKSIHLSNPSSSRFVTLNVAGLDDTMFSDTLFGHVKGAFTGAEGNRKGLISQASGGTLFLDEIGDLTQRAQVKLLRLIQQREYYPLGSDVPSRTDTRIVVATNKNLKQLVREEKFRKDLYFRLSAHQICIPPLRQRTEDIQCLTDYFLRNAAREMKKKPPTIPPQLYTILSNYSFPGNIRELESLVYDAVSRHRSGILSLDSFRDLLNRENIQIDEKESRPEDRQLVDFFEDFPTLKEAENFLIQEALKKAGGNQRITASLLGISRQALNKRLIRERRREEK